MAEGSLVSNAGDPEQIATADRKIKSREQRWKTLLAGLMARADFREFMAVHIDRCGVFDLEPANGSVEAVFTFLGRRYVGLKIVNELRTEHAEAYRLMELEAANRQMREQEDIAAAKQRRKGDA